MWMAAGTWRKPMLSFSSMPRILTCWSELQAMQFALGRFLAYQLSLASGLETPVRRVPRTTRFYSIPAMEQF